MPIKATKNIISIVSALKNFLEPEDTDYTKCHTVEIINRYLELRPIPITDKLPEGHDTPMQEIVSHLYRYL